MACLHKGEETKGFTLLELLIVIAIIGLLATMVVMVFNPGETLKKGRDGQRFSDLSALHTALAFYAITFPEKSLCDTSRVYVTLPSETAFTSCPPPVGFSGWYQVVKTQLKNIDGTGWLGINFDEVPGKSPIGFLPIDPRNTVTASCPDSAGDADFYYRFACDMVDHTWEFDTRLESEKYRTTEDRDGLDGGNHEKRYEIGRDTKLLPADE